LHRNGKGKIELAGSFYIGDNRPRNLTEYEADIYTDGSGGSAGATSDAVGLADIMTKSAKDAAAKNSNIFVYSTHDDNPDGSESLTGIIVYNESKYNLFLASVTISSEIDYMYELGTSTCTVSQCYSPAPPSMKGGPNSDYFATISVNQSEEISFVPSGEPTNMTNSFGAESLGASATLFFVSQTGPTAFTFKIK
jgi:hypothetical protein